VRRASVIVLLLAVVAACGGGDGGGGDGDPLAEGRRVYRAACSVCHGDAGEGGVGRPLDGVAATFPDCSDHVRWIGTGSIRWREEVGPTYGAQDRTIEGVMPDFSSSLTPAEIAAVAAYERAEFADVPAATAIAECPHPGGP